MDSCFSRIKALGIAAVAITFGVGYGLNAAELPYQIHSWDPQKVVGYEQCQSCHRDQVAVLKKHSHFSSYYRFHRSDQAKQIASRLGIRSIKRSERCNECHYTAQSRGMRVHAVSGISCESCHGPAQNWLTAHNNYGGRDVTRASEPENHRRQRIDGSIRAGMCHPSHLYAIARNCFRCHVIADEELVNEAGHPARTDGFELVRWSQGKTRHNFFRTNGRGNPASAAERLRVMHVVGLLADLEYSLRAVGAATANARFGRQHAQQVDRLRRALSEQVAAVPASDPARRSLDELVSALNGLKLRLNQQETLEAVADKISRAAWQISLNSDGRNWESLDDFVAPESEFIGSPVQP